MNPAPSPEDKNTELNMDKNTEQPMSNSDLHEWMRLQEQINREVAGEIKALRDEIEKLKNK